MRIWLLLPLLWAAPLAASEIEDGGGLFTGAQVATQLARFRDVEQRHGLETQVVTFREAQQQVFSSAAEKDEFFKDWLSEEATRRKARGLFVLICRQPGRIQVDLHSNRAGKPPTPADLQRLRALALPHLKSHDFDKALAAIADAVESWHEPDSGWGGWPLPFLLGLVGGLLTLLWILFSPAKPPAIKAYEPITEPEPEKFTPVEKLTPRPARKPAGTCASGRCGRRVKPPPTPASPPAPSANISRMVPPTAPSRDDGFITGYALGAATQPSYTPPPDPTPPASSTDFGSSSSFGGGSDFGGDAGGGFSGGSGSDF